MNLPHPPRIGEADAPARVVRTTEARSVFSPACAGRGLPVHHYRAEDAVAEAYAMVFLVESGFAQQMDVARAFGRSVRTVRRHQARYVQGGMAALGREEGWHQNISHARSLLGIQKRSVRLAII
jgi:hypothetical protein